MTTPVEVYAFDPGLATGWCHLSILNGAIDVYTCGEDDLATLGDRLMSATHLKDVPDLTFVSERYLMTSKISQAPWSLETIGLLRYMAHRYDAKFELVAMSSHKTLIGSKVVKKAKLWKPGMGHAMDAVSVGLWYAVTKRHLLQELLHRSNDV